MPDPMEVEGCSYCSEGGKLLAWVDQFLLKDWGDLTVEMGVRNVTSLFVILVPGFGNDRGENTRSHLSGHGGSSSGKRVSVSPGHDNLVKYNYIVSYSASRTVGEWAS